MYLKVILLIFVGLSRGFGSRNFREVNVALRIYDGSAVSKGQWPWMAPIFLKSNNLYHCGSTIISKSFSVTAAHCVLPKDFPKPFSPSDFFILFEGFDISLNHWTRRSILSIKIHPDWGKKWDDSTGTFDADIAILKFPSITFNTEINKISLPTLNSTVYGVDGTIVGFGFTRESQATQKVAEFAEIKSIDQETCFLHDSVYVTIASSRTFCGGGKIPCQGDSGSGFYVKENSQWKLLGIISAAIFTDDECDDSKFAIFTNVVSFLPWIHANIENDSSVRNFTNFRRNNERNFYNRNSTRNFHQVPNNFRHRGRNFNYPTADLSPGWSTWSDWSVCNATSCNQHGKTFRTRTCLTENCPGLKNEIRICHAANCGRRNHGRRRN